MTLMEDQIFQDVFKLYWELDYQIHIHQNGDAGLDRILDVLESNINSYPRKNHRTTIVHFGYSALDQVKRMKNLDVIVSANPYYVTVLSDLYSREGVGYERSQEMVMKWREVEVERCGSGEMEEGLEVEVERGAEKGEGREKEEVLQEDY